jgi:PDZ domain-containing protein
MSRRTATLVVSGVLLIILAVAAFAFPVPYAEETPGPTFNTLGSINGTPLIEIDGHTAYPTSGHLNMVTVDVTSPDNNMTIVDALRGWWSSGSLVVPKDAIYPPGQTASQSTEQDAAEFSNSQDAATVAALATLGIKPTATATIVASIDTSAPANGKLQPGDAIDSIDGTTITSPTQVTTVVGKQKPGAVITFVVTRNGKKLTVPVTAAASSSASNAHAYVGISIGQQHEFPFTVKIQLNNVGGPSAGMMFALGIIEKLTPGGITGGKFIAGTGTIDDNGNVGAIGGIQMKEIGARDAGATVFLTPAANCAEAKSGTPSGLELVKVSTLKDALNALAEIRAGQTPAGC